MKRQLTLFASMCLLSGCDLLFPPVDTTPPAGLKRFESEKEFTDYFSGQVMSNNDAIGEPGGTQVGAADGVSSADGGNAPTAAAPGAAGGTTQLLEDRDFSDTTTQEQGVAEADVVKTDGSFLYIISTDYNFTTGSSFSSLQIVRTPELTLVSDFPLEGYGRELYVHGDKIVALTETYGNFFFLGGGGIAIAATTDAPMSSDGAASTIVAPDADPSAPIPYEYTRPRTYVTVIDATDKAQPVMITRTAFDGTQSSSRMIDGVLHLVISNYQNYYFDILPALGRPEVDVGGVAAGVVLPQYTRVEAGGAESSGPVLTWEDVYRPNVPDGFGVVALVSLNADESTRFEATGIVAEPGMIYSSRDALYLTNTNYDFAHNDYRANTDVYKFAYTSGGTDLVASGRVRGRILNQYSMGEHKGFLRVATTVDPTFDENGVVSQANNNVYVLEDSGGTLNTVGSVENIAPRETIQSARFIGDRGYVVTFEQIDPLFTLDLTDPRNPSIAGELKIPGFSTFIVPIDENNLLAVGEDVPEPSDPLFFGPRGVQLSIFDVSDFTHPVLRHKTSIGADTGAYSEALYNPKAFTYFSQGGLLALPISIYEAYTGGGVIVNVGTGTAETPVVDGSAGGGSTGSAGSGETVPPDGVVTDVPPPPVGDIAPYVPGGFEGIKVYRVSPESGFTDMGSLSTRFEDAGYYYASFTRGVFIGENVYAVTDNGIRAAAVDNLAAPIGELLLRAPLPADPFAPPVDAVDPAKPLAGGTEPGSPQMDAPPSGD